MFKYFSLSNITAGFVGVLVGFTSSAVLVFQAATAAGATSAEISSWLLALGLGIAFSCISLSLRYKTPILVGWSTPGAALLITSLAGVSMSEATGAFIFASLLTVFVGITGLFERAIIHIPKSLSAAMLAGILVHFGINIFTAMQGQFSLVFPLFALYLIGKRFFPRYVIILVLGFGVILAAMQGLFHLENFHFQFSAPVFMSPTFSFHNLISIGIPLFIVTMTSQNIPGVAVLNASGYTPPLSPIISWIGLTNTLLAPFGNYSICLAALTGAICAGKEADPDPAKRYRATIFAGFCWITIGLLSATVVALFTAFPKELIFVVAGLALLSTIGNSLKTALEQEAQREPALITILVSSSGFSLFGIGAAFWGLCAGLLAMFLLNFHKKEKIPLPKMT